MRNIFLFVSCMVVFLSIIGCELKDENKKACGYKVKSDDNDPGLVLYNDEKAKEGFEKKTTVEKVKILDKALKKATTLEGASTLLKLRSVEKGKGGNFREANKDSKESKRLLTCLVDNKLTVM